MITGFTAEGTDGCLANTPHTHTHLLSQTQELAPSKNSNHGHNIIQGNSTHNTLSKIGSHDARDTRNGAQTGCHSRLKKFFKISRSTVSREAENRASPCGAPLGKFRRRPRAPFFVPDAYPERYEDTKHVNSALFSCNQTPCKSNEKKKKATSTVPKIMCCSARSLKPRYGKNLKIGNSWYKCQPFTRDPKRRRMIKPTTNNKK